METSVNAMQVALGEGNITPDSMKTYLKYLRKFYRRYEGGVAVTTEGVKNYIDTIYAPMKRNTRRLLTNILNTYVLKPRELELMPVPNKDTSKGTRTNHFTGVEIQRILEECERTNQMDMFHCITIASKTGLRISEILELKRGDLIEGCGKKPVEVVVNNGKGGKSRVVLIPRPDAPYFLEVLMPYVLSRKDEFLFRTKYDNWRKRLKKILHKCGIDEKRRCFHGMRSFFCTDKLCHMKFRNIPFEYEVLKNLMGHSSLSSLKTYIRPGSDQVLYYALNL